MAAHPLVLRGAFYISIIVFLEVIQTWMGQPWSDCFRDSLHFSVAVIFLVTSSFGAVGIFLLYAYEMTETSAYIFTGKTMDMVFLGALDPLFPIRADHPGLLVLGAIPVVSVILLVLLPPWICREETTSDDDKEAPPNKLKYCVFMIFLGLRGHLLVDKVRGEEPWFNTAEGVEQFKKLREYFMSPITTKFKPGVKPKNIIEIIPESFELQFLGDYNLKGYKKSMPFLSALAKNTTFFPNVDLGVMTAWSIGSIFASQCGIPLVCTPTEANNAQILQRMKNIKCAGDYLKILGYYNIGIYPGDANFGGIKPVLMSHGFQQFFDYRQSVRHDKSVIKLLERELPRVVEQYREKGIPFYMFLGLEDTHPPFRVNCDVRSAYAGTDGNKCMHAFDCMDQWLEIIMKMIMAQGLTSENTVIIIHGDHPLMRIAGGYKRSLVGEQAERKMAFIMPLNNSGVITKRTTVYDITPTLFDELQIDYSPEFPFGKSMLGEAPGEDPTKATIDFLWRYLNLA